MQPSAIAFGTIKQNNFVSLRLLVLFQFACPACAGTAGTGGRTGHGSNPLTNREIASSG
jgi:hypothetical protein